MLVKVNRRAGFQILYREGWRWFGCVHWSEYKLCWWVQVSWTLYSSQECIALKSIKIEPQLIIQQLGRTLVKKCDLSFSSYFSPIFFLDLFWRQQRMILINIYGVLSWFRLFACIKSQVLYYWPVGLIISSHLFQIKVVSNRDVRIILGHMGSR